MRNWTKIFLTIIISMICSIGIAQETITVSGTVNDEFGPTPDVQVTALKSGNTTTTDEAGFYEIQATSDDTLEFINMMGVAQNVAVNNQSSLDVTLGQEIVLQDVIAIGYGTQEKEDLTGSIAIVEGEEIEKTPTSNVMNALQGKVAGVQVVSAGAPGDSPKVRLRGSGSFQADGNPLYVVDGMWYDNIDFLNTSDIESMSVLKDASSTAIFGVRGAEGVVIITTKSGKRNKKTQITYSGYTGVQVAQNILKLANTEQFVTMAYESGSDADIGFVQNAIARYGRSRINPNLPAPNTDWYREILRPAAIQSHALDFAGGSENATYSIGANYLQQDGILNMKNEYQRFNLRGKLDMDVSDRFRIGINNIFSNGEKYAPENAAWFQAYFAVPLLPIYDYSKTDAYPEPFANAQDVGYRGPQNPFPVMNYNENLLKIRKILTNVYGEYELVRDLLTFRTQYSHDFSALDERYIRFGYDIGGTTFRETSLVKVNQTYSNQIWDNLLTLHKEYNMHDITVLLGQSYRDEAAHTLRGSGSGFLNFVTSSAYLDFADENTFQIGDNGARRYGISYFTRLQYAFADKYLLNATYRIDGSSKFTKDPWGYFPSVGLGWVVSKEPFMDNLEFIDFLKFRASWGQMGNDGVPAAAGSRTFSPVNFPIGDDLYTALVSANNYSDLVWEYIEETNFGVSAELFRKRLSIEADYYQRDTKDAIVPVYQPIVSNNVLQNVGSIRNKGFELALNWKNNLTENFSYNFGLNLTTLQNEVLELGGAEYLDSGSAEFRQRSYVGESMLAFYGYERIGVYQTEEQIANDPVAQATIANGGVSELVPGDLIYRDINGDGVITDEDRTILGSIFPDFTYGANLGFNWGNIDFSMSVFGQMGNQILNRKRGEIIFTSDTNMDADLAINRWHGEGTSNEYPSAAGLRKSWNQRLSNFWVENGDFFRIQNVQLGYNINDFQITKNQLIDIRVYLTAEKPWTQFEYNGFNPEVADGVDREVYPVPAIYTMGLNVKF